VPELSRAAVREAVRAVSTDGTFFYSARNLYYDLVRREAIPPPTGHAGDLKRFRKALAQHQRERGRLHGLVRAGAAKRAAVATELPDVFDYAVRRVLVFDRMDTCLIFAKNGFHRRIEIALVVLPDFPSHVWSRVLGQVSGGLRTAFYTAHDANRRGAKLLSKVRRTVREHGPAHFADVGITFAQAFAIGVPVRQRSGVMPAPAASLEEHEKLLSATGNYAHFEELTPLEMMRWTYGRIARGPEDPGFG
jgi:hypothetical protein